MKRGETKSKEGVQILKKKGTKQREKMREQRYLWERVTEQRV